MGAVLMAPRLRNERPIIDWHDEAPHNPEERIHWLRAEAAALISMARDEELRLPNPPAHACPPLCEFCLLKVLGSKP